ncbi:MAG: PH domain-containing protein [Ilumatobacteraceae bacterium]
MAFSRKSLNPDEELILNLHPHWWHFVAPISGMVAATVAAIYLTRWTGNAEWNWFKQFLGWTRWAIVGVALMFLAVRILQWRTTHFVVTSHRVIFRHGVIGKIGIDIPLERVNNVSIHQSVFERVVNAGDLLIESGGEDGQQRFSDISGPDEVQNIIHNAIRVHGGSRSNSAGSSVSQLERLEVMLQRGSITREEFDEQKQRLLG